MPAPNLFEGVIDEREEDRVGIGDHAVEIEFHAGHRPIDGREQGVVARTKYRHLKTSLSVFIYELY